MTKTRKPKPAGPVRPIVERLPGERWSEALMFTAPEDLATQVDSLYSHYIAIGEAPQDAVWLVVREMNLTRNPERDAEVDRVRAKAAAPDRALDAALDAQDTRAPAEPKALILARRVLAGHAPNYTDTFTLATALVALYDNPVVTITGATPRATSAETSCGVRGCTAPKCRR